MNPDRTSSEILDALYDFAEGSPEEVDTMSQEEIRNYLAEIGGDPDSLAFRMRERIRKRIGQRQLQQAREKHEYWVQRINALKAKAAGSPAQARQEILQLISRLIQTSPQPASVMYRKFEQAPDEDLQSLLLDFDLIDLLGNLDEPATDT